MQIIIGSPEGSLPTLVEPLYATHVNVSDTEMEFVFAKWMDQPIEQLDFKIDLTKLKTVKLYRTGPATLSFYYGDSLDNPEHVATAPLRDLLRLVQILKEKHPGVKILDTTFENDPTISPQRRKVMYVARAIMIVCSTIMVAAYATMGISALWHWMFVQK